MSTRLRTNPAAADSLFAATRAMHPGARAEAFVAQWWDGMALVPALLVVIEGRKLRAVTGPEGGLLLLPRSSWAARRRLRRARRTGRFAVPDGRGAADRAAGDGGSPDVTPYARPHVAVTPGGLPRTRLLYEVAAARPHQPVRPGPRPPVRLGGAVDYRGCTHVGCGAIVPLPAEGGDPPCPRCGRR